MTAEDLDRLPDDGFRYELQSGLLVSEPLPGFRHGRVAANAAFLLRVHVERHGLDLLVVAESGFILSRSPDTVRGPDVAVVTRRRADRASDPRRSFPGAPDLAVEVVSPSNSSAELHARVADYLASGARLVWVVDPEEETVTVYRDLLAPRTLLTSDSLTGEDVVPDFRVEVAELFES